MNRDLVGHYKSQLFSMLKMVEAGLIERWQQEFFPPDKCNDQATVESPPISLKDLSGVFVILGIGCGGGLLMLMLETLYYR